MDIRAAAKPRQKGFYGLDRLRKGEDRQIIFVSSQRAADAGETLFPSNTVIAWFGQKDCSFDAFADKKIVLIANADIESRASMEWLEGQLKQLKCSVKVAEPEDERPREWSIADAEWTSEQAVAWTRERIAAYGQSPNVTAPAKEVESSPSDAPPEPVAVAPINGHRYEIPDDAPDAHLFEEPARAPMLAPLRHMDWSGLQGEPPLREWAIHGWLGYGHITALVGSGGIGKTLLSQQIASHLALGAGPFIDTLQGPTKVLMWGCEDEHDEFWRRQVPIAASLERPLSAFSKNLFIVPRHGMDNAMITQTTQGLAWTPRLEELRQQAFDLRARVVILDNSAQLYGGNENDRHAVTYFLNGLSGALPGCAILLLSHPARAIGSEYSGSSAWENTARARLYLGTKMPDDKSEDGESDQNVRYLSRRKSNYSNKDWRRFNYDNGVLRQDAEELNSGLFAHLRSKKTDRILIDGALALKDKGIRFTDGVTSPDFLPRKILEYRLAEGCNKQELAASMRAAIMDGRLVRGAVGMYSNRSPMQGLIVSPPRADKTMGPD